MGCKHRSVTSSSRILDNNAYDEVFEIKCYECNCTIHKDLGYDDFINTCKDKRYLIVTS